MKTRLFLLSSALLALALLIQPLQASFAAPQPSTGDLVFDFAANAAYAQWKGGAGSLPFPGTSGDYRGYAQLLEAPVQEDGTLGAPGLLTVPHNKYDGYIQGTYPEFAVQKGDRFQATVGCEYGATGCYVTFRLDYITAAGATKVFWTWKEKYEGRTYSANLDLSALAGQRVRFVLTMLATGYASGDRPLWVAPRIVRPGNGLTPMPTLTPTATPFVTPPPVTPSACDRASFVADVTVRDGTTFAPGEAFTKTWRLKNSGSCTWTKNYALVFYGGEQMEAPTAVNLPWAVAPGAMVDVTVNAVAPSTSGSYRGDWILRNASGQLFGIGTSGDKPFWVLINVIGTPPVADTGYDFAANLCAAQWQSGAGALPCPHTDGDSRGFALAQQTRLEDGSVAASAILTQPQNKYDGYIQGTYPTFTVQPGDRFQAVVGCEHNANCYVTFRLEYLTAGGAPRIFWKWSEKNEGKTYKVDLDLSSLAGQSLRFVLTTLAAGPATGDRAVWAEPRIVRPGLQPPTPTPTPTPIPSPGTIVPSPLIRGLVMLDASNGWATGDNYVLRTMNGGVTWYNVLPDAAPGGAFFLNSTTGWVIANSGALYRTTDGGYQWTQFTFPLCGEHLQCYLQFLNNNDGFLLTGGPIGMFKYPVTLYQTGDGGASWTIKFAHVPEGTPDGLPLGGYKYGVVFRDLLNGWINGGDYPADGYFYLFRTSDGGLTWSHVQPALPAGYESAFITIGAPKFFGANQAILPVWMTIGAGMRDLFLYTSYDGGNTWTPSAGYARNVDAVDIISMSNAISWGNHGNFFVTSNSGGNWTTLTPNVDFGEGYRALDFVSASTGWLIQDPVNGSTPLYRTLNGGFTWTLLSGGFIPTPEPGVFAQSIVDALNARNFDVVRASMDQVVAFGYWGSQGIAYTPEQAIEALQTNYLGATPLVSNPNEDLNSLLDGMNPYAIMGLDPARSQALYVSGWGADGKTEAILYVTRRADGSLYFFGLLLAPFGFTHATPTPLPTPTETPIPTPTTVFTSPYAVIGVHPEDVLNMYAEAGTSNVIVGSFPANTRNIERGTDIVIADMSNWVQARIPGGITGWVYDRNLTEYITPEQFVTDSRPIVLVEKLKQAMSNSDGNLFASLVSPKRGVQILYHGTWGSNMVIYMPEQARDAFTSTDVINWGMEGASGMNAVGTFAEKVQPKLQDVLNSAYELHPNDPNRAYMYVEPWPGGYQNLNYFAVLKPPTPGIELDWRIWLVGFEYVDGVPYIMTMLHYVWEP
jgi:photosystem II stability/assembly factor-like uncharacterized protein